MPHLNQGEQTNFSFESGESGAKGLASLDAWCPARWPVAAGWRATLSDFLAGEAAQRLETFITGRLAAGAVIYPPRPLRALELTPLADVRVVIVGQDPYHGPGQAEGLAFSVATGVKLPPSLRNIFKEIARDTATSVPAVTSMSAPADQGSLVRWSRQGVLLLNTCLTVEQGLPGSHAKQGWEALTHAIIKMVLRSGRPVVFMLWGAHAQQFARVVSEEGGVTADVAGAGHHLVLTANHPSPLSALRPPQPFIGCGHFGLANAFLQRQGCQPIHW